jgi:hypothetical protein
VHVVCSEERKQGVYMLLTQRPFFDSTPGQEVRTAAFPRAHLAMDPRLLSLCLAGRCAVEILGMLR